MTINQEARSKIATFLAFLERGIPFRTTYLQRRSLFLMRVGVCLALLANALIVIGYISGTTGIQSILNITISSLIYILSLALMLRGQNSLGRNIFAIAIIVMTWQVCLVISPDSQTILFFLPISIGGTLLWSGERVKQIAFSLISICWYLIAAHTISATYFNGQRLVSNPTSPSLIINMLVVFGATFLIAAANEQTASNLQKMLLRELERNQKLLADAMPSFVLNQLTALGGIGSSTTPNATFVIVDLVNVEEFQKGLSAAEVSASIADILSRLSFFAEQFRLIEVQTNGYAMVAIAKQSDLQDKHRGAALEFAVAARNSLATIISKGGKHLQFRIGIANTEINTQFSNSVQQIKTEWAQALDRASRLESSAPLNQIQISGEMGRSLNIQVATSEYGSNYLVM